MTCRTEEKQCVVTQQFEKSGDHWLIASAVMSFWYFFISYLLYQYCGADFLAGNMLGIPKYLSWVDMWKFSAMQMPLPLTTPLSPTPTVCEGIEFQIYRSSQTYFTLLNASKIEFVDSSQSIPQIIESRKGRISHIRSSRKRDLEAAEISGILHWHMAYDWEEFLKEPLLVLLQNSGAYEFVSMQFTAPDFPAMSKKSSHCTMGEISANLNSDNGAEFGWTLLL